MKHCENFQQTGYFSSLFHSSSDFVGHKSWSKFPLTGVSIVYTLNRRHRQIRFVLKLRLLASNFWSKAKQSFSCNFLSPTQLIIFNYPVIISYRCSTTVFLEINFAGLTFAPRSKKPYLLANSWCVVMISAGRRMVAETLWKFLRKQAILGLIFIFYPILLVVNLDQSSLWQV